MTGIKLSFIRCDKHKADILVGVDGKYIGKKKYNGGTFEGTPYITIGNDEVENAPPLGTEVECPQCGETHKVHGAIEENNNDETIELLSGAVERAWKEEKIFSKSFLKDKIKRTDSVCQGISRNIFHRIYGVFPNTTMLEFSVNGKTHIVVYSAFNLKSYVLDGAIKQFLPNEARTVFLVKDYPFKKELQSAKRFL